MKKKLKVANIIEDGRLAGPQIRILLVANKLKEKVKTIVIVPKRNSERFQNKLIEYGVSFKLFKLNRLTRQRSLFLLYILGFPFEIYFLYRFFKKEKFDLIHVSGGAWQFKGVLAAKIAKIQAIWHLNDTSMPWIFKIIFRFLSKNISGIIVAAKKVEQYYFSEFSFKGKQIELIPAPVDCQFFDPKKIKPQNEFLIKDRIIIGMVSNITPLKGIDTFIKISRLLNLKFDNLQFFILGAIYKSQRSYFKKILILSEKLGVQNIRFLGARDDTRSFYKSIDIYICTSNAEASPLSVWEAMSMAKPIVSHDVGDISNFIKDNINGFIVPKYDLDLFSEKISLLIENKELRNRFGMKSRKIALKFLDLDICAKKHLDFYERIIRVK